VTANGERGELHRRVRASEERLRLGETAGGIATFELDLSTGKWNWSSQAAVVFGIAADPKDEALDHWQKAIFFDDAPKIVAATEAAAQTGKFYVEFRITARGGLRWIVARGEIGSTDGSASPVVRGAIYDITERKALEARLLALNETLEARVLEAREESHALDMLNRIGIAVAAEHDLQRLVQMVTDAGVELTHAAFGAFFYNVIDEKGEAYTLYTLSGAPRDAFEKFPMPRNTAVFEPTFRGTATVRSADVLGDPRYGHNPPYHGMPKGHLPVRSYLAVPVTSRSGEVLGGLFFGHSRPGVFTSRAERLATGLAAQAAVAIDNARLYAASKREVAARAIAEEELQRLNQSLEQRIEKRAAELAASAARLEDTERRFRLLVEGVTDYAIFMLDPDGRIINWNPGAERTKGYKREEILGRHFSTFYTEEDRRAGIPTKALSIAAQTGKFEAEGWRVRKDESRFWAHVVINAIKDANGKIVGFAKITRDLTERRAAEERAKQAQKMEAVGQLTGGVAHDFNNLLTIIIGNLETLQRNLDAAPVDVDRLRRSMTNAMTGARRAETLTQRLLAFSRQQPLEPKSLDISRLVTGMTDMLRRTLGEHITVETILGGGVWQAHSDPNQLELAIINLAVNARDAMPNGGRLTLETANVYLDERYAIGQIEVVPGQYVMLAITDNGSGMTPEVKAKAFDPFFTTKDVGHGTGLGLSQVYGFVKQSRGHVKIYSEIGEGTTIKLYLPRAHSTASVKDEHAEVHSLPRGSGAEIVLVVEDDPDVRTYTCDTLRELGYIVLEAENGRRGLALLKANPQASLLFTDVGLPGGMNGRQLADEARRRRPDLKVLFTTGYARNAIVHDGRLDPGVELITKPFSQAALASKLRDILDARRVPGRILLVEDEPLIQMLAAEYLEDANFQVDVAESAAEAINKLALVPGSYDAVVIDVGLPDRKGDTLIHEMKAIYSHLPIVLATGHNTRDLRAKFKDQTGLAFANKPYTAEELLNALRSLGVGRRRSE
jgi:PAS domain S-box-containing protein